MPLGSFTLHDQNFHTTSWCTWHFYRDNTHVNMNGFASMLVICRILVCTWFGCVSVSPFFFFLRRSCGNVQYSPTLCYCLSSPFAVFQGISGVKDPLFYTCFLKFPHSKLKCLGAIGWCLMTLYSSSFPFIVTLDFYTLVYKALKCFP